MEYKEEFANKLVWIDRLKMNIECNEENKEIFSKFCPNVFQEISNFNEVKPKKRVRSSTKKPK